jgi:A/G-specific adenine glycosylase
LRLLRLFAAIISGVAKLNRQSAIGNRQLNRLVPLLLDWFSQNARDLPWRRTHDPYAIWVSEIMLQQTQVKTAMPYWNRWMRELPTIEAAAKASPAKIHKLWEGLGYYTRVRNLQKAAKQIVECRMRSAESGNSGCQFPENYDDILALPGIGRYTAGAICSIAFNQPTPILDGNVIRVLTRIFGIGGNPKERKTNARLWKLAEELVCQAANSRTRTRRKEEDDCCSHLNQSLMELGALVCMPRNPQCRICPVKNLCVAIQDNRVEELPNLGKRETATARRFAAFVVERNGRFLVRQRPAGVMNAHLWEFPNVEVAAGILPAVEPGFQPGGKSAGNFKPVKVSRNIPGGKMPPSTAGETPAATLLAYAAKNLGLEIRSAKHLATVKHSITRYRITLDAFRVSSGGTISTSPHSEKTKSGTRETRPSEKAGVWKTPAQMQSLAFTSAYRKVLVALTARTDR